jgi:thioesterase domain-containing protein
MASYYIEIIQAVQPRGPYDLGGFSFGGLIAYEIARQLQERGEIVNTIAMADALDLRSLLDSLGLKSSTEASPLIEEWPVKGWLRTSINFMLTVAFRSEDLPRLLIHRNELDFKLAEEEFLDRAASLAKDRGLGGDLSHIKLMLRTVLRLTRAFEVEKFSTLPLIRPEEVDCYYFRNMRDAFYGELEPFLSLREDGWSPDSTSYWRSWAEKLPRFHLIDVYSASHFALLTDKNSSETIMEFCRNLYSADAAAYPAIVGQ